ncbi:MAG: glycosyltransferase [Anaeromyxobacteraceae bacterium]|nr:glycosyltransferase [Anaeromyxobacteraceae bacterium]
MRNGPLRVLHLLGELRPSGAETMLVVAAPVFKSHQVTSEILSTGEAPGPYAERMAAAGYRIQHLRFAKSPAFFLALWRLLRRGRYDALHVHTERAAFWISLTGILARVPVILKSIHNNFAFSGNLRARRMVQRHLMAWWGVRQVAVGRSVQETERRRYRLETVLVNNWFDEERFRPPEGAEREAARRSLGLADGEVALASVGNCNEFKNHGELLRALALLPPGRRPVYLHVGAEEPGLPERALAERLGLGDRVRFLGSLSDVRPVLHAADGFVMPSLREGLSISALEALATGLPAILSDVDGLRELGEVFAGVRLPAPRADALAAALEAFLEEGAEARWRTARGYPEAARLTFGVRTGAGGYVRIYRGG